MSETLDWDTLWCGYSIMTDQEEVSPSGGILKSGGLATRLRSRVSFHREEIPPSGREALQLEGDIETLEDSGPETDQESEQGPPTKRQAKNALAGITRYQLGTPGLNPGESPGSRKKPGKNPGKDKHTVLGYKATLTLGHLTLGHLTWGHPDIRPPRTKGHP